MFKIRHYELHPELFYDPDTHLWLRVEGNRARVGLDPLEQETRGAFVVIQLAKPGQKLSRGEAMGTVEAEKYVGSLQAPVSGRVAAVNPAVLTNPRLVNSDPYGEGWLLELEMSNFQSERAHLLTGEETLRDWYQAEIRKYEDWGWLAES
ncbi:MAG: glycine cleavage system protein H [Calditrichaeota bacterium]|nr:MAG: glycine cleavage system protein H [Calditrichota bacterium]